MRKCHFFDPSDGCRSIQLDELSPKTLFLADFIKQSKIPIFQIWKISEIFPILAEISAKISQNQKFLPRWEKFLPKVSAARYISFCQRGFIWSPIDSARRAESF